MATRRYKVIYDRDETGWWVATIPSVPGCLTQGKTLEQARRRIREALSLYVEDRAASTVNTTVVAICRGPEPFAQTGSSQSEGCRGGRATAVRGAGSGPLPGQRLQLPGHRRVPAGVPAAGGTAGCRGPLNCGEKRRPLQEERPTAPVGCTRSCGEHCLATQYRRAGFLVLEASVVPRAAVKRESKEQESSRDGRCSDDEASRPAGFGTCA